MTEHIPYFFPFFLSFEWIIFTTPLEELYYTAIFASDGSNKSVNIKCCVFFLLLIQSGRLVTVT